VRTQHQAQRACSYGLEAWNPPELIVEVWPQAHREGESNVAGLLLHCLEELHVCVCAENWCAPATTSPAAVLYWKQVTSWLVLSSVHAASCWVGLLVLY
jgi:hypothetical protein